MIKKRITKDALSLTLTPNKSSTVQQNLIFFGFLSVLCLTFAIGFFVLGATMILPFAGLEIMLLFIILRVNSFTEKESTRFKFFVNEGLILHKWECHC